MTYYSDLTGEIAMICLSMSLNGAEAFVDRIDPDQLTPTEHVYALSAAATRIGGCAKYDPASAFAAASRVTERALSIYEPGNGDQTMELIGMIVSYMDYPDSAFSPDGLAIGLLSVFETWIDVWAGAESALDPNWTPDARFPLFDDPRVQDGQTPESIADPTLRAAYQRHRDEKRRFLEWSRSQGLLRRALAQYRPDYMRQAARLRALGAVDEALAALAQRVHDPDLRAAMGG